MREEVTSHVDRYVPVGSTWTLSRSVWIYDTPSGSRGGFTGMPAGNCTVLVLNVVRAVMKEVHVWVHVLAGDRLGYINRVHFNADGAAVKRS